MKADNSVEKMRFVKPEYKELTQMKKLIMAFKILWLLAFSANAEIIIQGTIEKDGVFKTTSLSIKCPSKYVDSLEESSDI